MTRAALNMVIKSTLFLIHSKRSALYTSIFFYLVQNSGLIGSIQHQADDKTKSTHTLIGTNRSFIQLASNCHSMPDEMERDSKMLLEKVQAGLAALLRQRTFNPRYKRQMIRQILLLVLYSEEQNFTDMT